MTGFLAWQGSCKKPPCRYVEVTCRNTEVKRRLVELTRRHAEFISVSVFVA
ncbi:MAG: hypothetical protein ACJA0T_001282 [Colwellia sp.]|jgi:hypothetical protein